MSGIGANIRRQRERLGWSQARLAREVCRAACVAGDPVGRQEVSRWETGKRTPREWLPFLAAALGVPVETLTAPQTAAEPPLPTLADFLPAEDPLEPLQGRTGGRIGMGQVDDLQQRVHGLRLADDFLAGGDLMRPALRELRKSVRMFRERSYSDLTGRQLLVQIGELAQIAGWIASDAGQHEEAERIYRLGLSAATQAEDRTLAGNLAGSLAYQMSNVGREVEGLDLARAALDGAGPTAPPKARALYLDRVAWAATKAGGTENAQHAMRALGEASEALAEDSEGTESPAYLYWVDAGELRVMESRVYTELRRPLRAVPLLRDVLGRYDATHTRELALYLSWLAVAYADANEPEESAATAERMLTLSADIASERTAERGRVVLARLAEYADVPEVRAVLESAAA
ncbi:helix-turn-helix domain-containing protein [Streptomyces mirabilis]|uniref:helix-turn-helix transcriptional regulator n=1 Tax=Streptomyces mirabilis TaxID=68239 RepID=UPI0021C163A3|nr:helix-turn-helix transcriptional regulator [Streptomyces mirabilis]MCT9108316.1 helix-turn-helix domain-containing protein [Streptomyces mirabilis]